MRLLRGKTSLQLIYAWPQRFPNGAPLPLRLLLRAVVWADRWFFRFFPGRPPAELENILRGRKVCIAGPSKSIELLNRSAVESYDVIVRLNNTWPVDSKRQAHTGARCEIWYHVCNEVIHSEHIGQAEGFADILHVRLMPHVNGQSLHWWWWKIWSGDTEVDPPGLPNQYSSISSACREHKVPQTDFHHGRTMRYLTRMGEKPPGVVNTGFFAICELLDCDLSELHVTGITFNRENDYDGYPGPHGGLRQREGDGTHHNADNLFEIFCRLVQRDSRITMDDTLSRFVRQHETS